MLAILACSGCSVAPSLPVFGAAFPAWLFCLVGGVIATVIVHIVLHRMKRIATLRPLVLSYPGITAIVAVVIWLIVFAY